MDADKLHQQIETLSAAIDRDSDNATLYLERGRLYHRSGAFDKALNDYTRVLQLDPANTEAAEYSMLLREIFAFRNTDLYNP